MKQMQGLEDPDGLFIISRKNSIAYKWVSAVRENPILPLQKIRHCGDVMSVTAFQNGRTQGCCLSQTRNLLYLYGAV